MNRHAIYPPVFRTVQPRSRYVIRFVKSLLVGCVLAVTTVGTIRVIHTLWTLDAQLDNAYLAGMKTGNLVCRGGV
jgi:hypothetical protein